MKTFEDNLNFLKRIKDLKELLGCDSTQGNLFVLIDEDKKTAIVNSTGLIGSDDAVSYIIVFYGSKQINKEYTNYRYYILGMFDHNYNTINSIVFDKWKLIDFSYVITGFYKQRIKPQLQSESGETKTLRLDYSFSVDDFNKILKDIWAFEEENP